MYMSKDFDVILFWILFGDLIHSKLKNILQKYIGNSPQKTQLYNILYQTKTLKKV